MPTIMTCPLHKDASVSHLTVDPCPLCRALDEIDLLNSKLHAAIQEVKSYEPEYD